MDFRDKRCGNYRTNTTEGCSSASETEQPHRLLTVMTKTKSASKLDSGLFVLDNKVNSVVSIHIVCQLECEHERQQATCTTTTLPQ